MVPPGRTKLLARPALMGRFVPKPAVSRCSNRTCASSVIRSPHRRGRAASPAARGPAPYSGEAISIDDWLPRIVPWWRSRPTLRQSAPPASSPRTRLPLSKKMQLTECNLARGIGRHGPLWGKKERTSTSQPEISSSPAWRLAVVAFVAAALGYTRAKAGT